MTAAVALASARARAEVDPRWRYSAELSPAVALPFGEVTASKGKAISLPTGSVAFELRAAFFAPVAENRQLGGAVWWDTQGDVRVHGAMRFISDFVGSPISTRLELGIVADVQPQFSIGPRVAVGLADELAPGWSVGGELGAAFLFVHFAAVLDASATIAFMF